jgi:hypothetical protein
MSIQFIQQEQSRDPTVDLPSFPPHPYPSFSSYSYPLPTYELLSISQP